MPIELVFVIGMVVLFTLALKVKANAFISLLATALVMGLLSGMSGPATIKAITGGFSGTVKSIGIVIIFGIMVGNFLDAAKGTNRMALDTIRMVGQKHASLAMKYFYCGHHNFCIVNHIDSDMSIAVTC